MNEKSKEKIILNYLFNNGPTYSHDLQAILEDTIPRSTFFSYLKQLKNNKLIKMETILGATKTRKRYTITNKGIQYNLSAFDDNIIKLKIDLKDIEKNFFPLLERLEREFPLTNERKILIYLTWPLITNTIPNYIQSESLFAKHKFFILINQLSHDLEQKNLISYTEFSKIFNLKEIDLKFYLEKLIEQTTFPDWHKLEINDDQDMFYSYSFGFGRALYSLIIYFMKSDLSFNPILNLTPIEFSGELSVKLPKLMEKLLPISSVEQYFEHYFDYEKEIIKILPQNIKFFIKKFFNSDYSNAILNHSKIIPYEKLWKTQEWRKISDDMSFSNFFNSFNEILSETKFLKIHENLAMEEIIIELIFLFEIEKLALKYFSDKEKRINLINSYITILNEKLSHIIKESEQGNENIDDKITIRNIGEYSDSIRKKSGKTEELDEKLIQVAKEYNMKLKQLLKLKLFGKLDTELKNYPGN